MNSPKLLLVLGLLLVLSLAVLADTSKEKEGYVVDAEKEVNSVEATDGIEPQQGGHGCKHGCCRWSHGRCIACCHAEKEVNSVQATDGIEPQQGGHHCKHGCCKWSHGRCIACCHPRKVAEKETDTVEPQKRGRCGGCRCCGACAFNRCSACC